MAPGLCPTCFRVPPCEHPDQRFLDVWAEVEAKYRPLMARLAAHDRGEHDGGCPPSLGALARAFAGPDAPDARRSYLVLVDDDQGVPAPRELQEPS